MQDWQASPLYVSRLRIVPLFQRLTCALFSPQLPVSNAFRSEGELECPLVLHPPVLLRALVSHVSACRLSMLIPKTLAFEEGICVHPFRNDLSNSSRARSIFMYQNRE
jgi:hypothetical protein